VVSPHLLVGELDFGGVEADVEFEWSDKWIYGRIYLPVRHGPRGDSRAADLGTEDKRYLLLRCSPDRTAAEPTREN